MTDEYRLKRIDLGGSPEIYVGLHESPPVVLADHGTPEWVVDAKVRASLIDEFIAKLKDEPDYQPEDARPGYLELSDEAGGTGTDG
ncbi:hypothetical protein [Amycolatopsis taiwanensis]|uniref:hypothetical protein n=1 Tax=Amycolatopsis taiwanensis TaxID=342230 RepID=UPI0004890324|nr:hypothetical protein [Amycolatopsis taiwanensis]